MELSLQSVIGFSIHATDGELGNVDEFLFDDKTWTIRYLVAKTGSWLLGRKVLISLPALGKPDWETGSFYVNLTCDQVRNSPEIDTDQQVYRTHEENLHEYYQWPQYWDSGYSGILGITPFPVFDDPLLHKPIEPTREVNPNLRSTKMVTGYHIHATNGEIGHVEDFIVDDENWRLQYLVIATKNWLPGKKVTIPITWVKSVNWMDASVYIDKSLESVRSSPEYEPSKMYDANDVTSYKSEPNDTSTQIVTINRLNQLDKLGQSLWLDYIRRDLIPKLPQMIQNDALRGITSNPAIFKEAIVGSHLYDSDIKALALKGKSILEIYEALSGCDVQMAADALRPVYDKTDGKDGYVSLEVNPHLAHDTNATTTEARRLWKSLDRPNVFIKVPATIEGLVAIKQLITDGININVTLIFGLSQYQQVARAYCEGIEARLALGKDVSRVASVASFFISRIDTLIDPMLEKIIELGGKNAEKAKAGLGQVAISSAKLAYQMYKETFTTFRFKRLEYKGARAQRVLWASTGTKNPAYSDVKYIEALIGPNTVNTIPLETLSAFQDHGTAALRLEDDIDTAADIMDHLGELGIRIDGVTLQLEKEGVDKFNKPFDVILEALAAATKSYVGGKSNDLA